MENIKKSTLLRVFLVIGALAGCAYFRSKPVKKAVIVDEEPLTYQEMRADEEDEYSCKRDDYYASKDH